MMHKLQEFVSKKMLAPDIIRGMAEESAELTHALLKLDRVCTGVNPTPVTRDEAIEAVVGEMVDVLMYARLIGLFDDKMIDVVDGSPKWERWVKRLYEVET